MKLKAIRLLLLSTAAVLLVACGGGTEPAPEIEEKVEEILTAIPTIAPTPTRTPASLAQPEPTAPLGSPPTPTAAGVTVVVTTGGTNEHDRDQIWAFTAKEGTFVRINGGPAQGSSINLALELFGPDGSLLEIDIEEGVGMPSTCLLYTSPSPRDVAESRKPASA